MLVWQKYALDTGSIINYARTQTKDGFFTQTINGVTYAFEVINFTGDVTYSQNTVLGSSSSVNTRMVIAHYHGNLTINSGVKLTAVANSSGYGGPKGLFICVDGTLTNNGEISMTARGASAAGQNVWLYKSGSAWEYIPAVGGAGAARPNQIGSTSTSSPTGNTGPNGSNGSSRGTGGGGAGASRVNGSSGHDKSARGGAGGAGTSYSGGPGGGAEANYNWATLGGGNGSSSGGAGGAGRTRDNLYSTAGGGAGNAGGSGSNKSASDTALSGGTGTGGLLIIYAADFKNNGSITSRGSTGGKTSNSGVPYAGGGGSGGGSINVFYKNAGSLVQGITSVSGGVGGYADYRGGSGGAGSVTFTQCQ